MKLLRVTLLALLASLPLCSPNLYALSVDDSNNPRNGAALAGDPDDKIPYPHVADDGKPVSNFHGQPAGNSGMTFSTAPSSSGSGRDNAFQRAQERMQQ